MTQRLTLTILGVCPYAPSVKHCRGLKTPVSLAGCNAAAASVCGTNKMRTRPSGRSLSEPFQVLRVQSKKAYRNARKDFPLKPRLLYIFVALLGLAVSPPLRAQGAGPSANSGSAGEDPAATHSISGVLLDSIGRDHRQGAGHAARRGYRGSRPDPERRRRSFPLREHCARQVHRRFSRGRISRHPDAGRSHHQEILSNPGRPADPGADGKRHSGDWHQRTAGQYRDVGESEQ